jgi:hypothetical protein
MRRLVDSLILVLVVYSIGLPVVRSLTYEGTPARDLWVHVCVEGCGTTPGATVRAALSKADAEAANWLDVAVQPAGAAGTSLRCPPGSDTVWVTTSLPGAELPAREVDLRAVAGPLTIRPPDTLRVMVVDSRVPDGRLRVTTIPGAPAVAFDVACDPAGVAVFAVRDDASAVRLHDERGECVGEFAAPPTPGVHHVGRLGR